MNTDVTGTKNDSENPPVRKGGRPRKNTVQLHVRISPETMKFLRYKARRKVSLGNVVERAVRHLEVDLMAG